MLRDTPFAVRVMLLAGFAGMVSACAITTRSTEGTSETLQNTSEASTDFTSSTSPRNEARDMESQRVKQFASVNLDRLKEEMARGGGEHLTAFAYLLGVKESQQPEFFTVAKRNYPVLFKTEQTTSEEMLARLYTELDAHPTWRR